MSQLEKLSSNQVKLTIEVSKEVFNEAIVKVYPEVSKDTKLDGFRPGKIPMNIFITHFGYAPLYEEAVNEAINNSYIAAVREHNVNIVDYPKIDLDFSSVEHDKGFTYSATVFVMPDVELVKYTGIEFPVKSKRVTKKEVSAEIEKELKNHAENVLKEGPAELGDIVIIDFEGFVDGKTFEGGKAENYELELGSGSFIPGFEDQLLGMKEGAELDVNVTFPEKYTEELAGKDATFKVKVHEVKNKEVPALNEEFVKELEIENVNTVEEYQAHIEKKLKEEKEKVVEDDFMMNLFKNLTELNPIDVPAVMIDRYASELEDNYKKQAQQYNIPFEMFLQFQGLNEETFKERTRIQAENQIKIDLIIEAVQKKEDFKVSEKAIEVEFQTLADANKITVEKAKEHVSVEDVKYHLQRGLAIDFLKANNGKVKKAKSEKTKEEK